MTDAKDNECGVKNCGCGPRKETSSEIEKPAYSRNSDGKPWKPGDSK